LFYHEDFSTSSLKDTIATTADWDTTTGTLQPFQFAPRVVSTHKLWDRTYGVAISGNHLFMGIGGLDLATFDITDPAFPVQKSLYRLPGALRDLAVSGANLFVAVSRVGLVTIDVSDPEVPALKGICDETLGPHALTVSGNYAYVADEFKGFEVIDISEPQSPVLRGSYPFLYRAEGVAIYENYAFAATRGYGIEIIDITDPEHPTLAGVFGDGDSSNFVASAGHFAYAAIDYSNLQVIDIGDPVHPVRVGECSTKDIIMNVAISGDLAMLACSLSGYQLVDVSDPENPLSLGVCPSNDFTGHVAISANYAFGTASQSGLKIIQIAEPTDLVPAGSYDTPEYAHDVTVLDNHAYVANGYSGLEIFDLSNPKQLIHVGTWNTPNSAQAVAVAGTHAYVADGLSGLQVIDVSDPRNPVLSGNIDTPDYTHDVALSGQYAFVAGSASGLQVVDITIPETPTIVGTCKTPGNQFGVDTFGRYVLVAAYDAGLQVIDAADPTNPIVVGSYATPDHAYGVSVYGNDALVACYRAGLLIIDISNPTSPSLVGNYDTNGEAWGVDVSGGLAFVADGASGVQVIDISDLSNPTLAVNVDTPDLAYAVDVWGDYVLLADRNSGVHRFQRFQHRVDMSRNRAQSLSLDESNDIIPRVRLRAEQMDSVAWEVSSDSGDHWLDIAADWNWKRILSPGEDLRWRSTNTWIAPGVVPVVDDLQIEWRVANAPIQSIVDLPGDQGGWARLSFQRSGFDFADESIYPVTGYYVHQRIDDVELRTRVLEQGVPLDLAGSSKEAEQLAAMGEFRGLDERTFVVSEGSDSAVFPPGVWEVVASVPALQQDEYTVRVPTVADSTAAGVVWSTFVVSTHTTSPSVWYLSRPDSVYTVDNLAPSVPTGLSVVYHTNRGNQLSWDRCPDDDFQYFKIYRSEDPYFIPSSGSLVHATTETSWVDSKHHASKYLYRVSAVDFAGNESASAYQSMATAVEGSTTPRVYALYPNVPNPFNPRTSIRYDIPTGGGAVALKIYDLSGTLVRTLVNEWQSAGEKTVNWDGRDGRGKRVASGVYTYRLQAPGFLETKKMVLLK